MRNLILIIFAILILYIFSVDNYSENTILLKNIASILLVSFAIIYLYGLLFGCGEGFHFEVSDYKKSCLNNIGKCKPKCGCCRGLFHGQPQSFEYTGDAARMNAFARGCSCRDSVGPSLANRVFDYESLDQTYAPYKAGDKCGSETGTYQENYIVDGMIDDKHSLLDNTWSGEDSKAYAGIYNDLQGSSYCGHSCNASEKQNVNCGC